MEPSLSLSASLGCSWHKEVANLYTFFLQFHMSTSISEHEKIKYIVILKVRCCIVRIGNRWDVLEEKVYLWCEEGLKTGGKHSRFDGEFLAERQHFPRFIPGL